MMEKSVLGYILEADVLYANKFYELHSEVPFLPERIKFGKVEKFVR